MVVHGRESTVPVTLDEIAVHDPVGDARREAAARRSPTCRSARTRSPTSRRCATRFASSRRAARTRSSSSAAGTSVARARAIVGAGIPVMGHVGLTPQTATVLGGFKAQGRTAERARQLVEDARRARGSGLLRDRARGGACRPWRRGDAGARRSRRSASAPARRRDGQVLVWHDLLGFYEGRAPRFVKRYAKLGEAIVDALGALREEVRSGSFPEEQHTYAMPEEEPRRSRPRRSHRVVTWARAWRRRSAPVAPRRGRRSRGCAPSSSRARCERRRRGARRTRRTRSRGAHRRSGRRGPSRLPPVRKRSWP